MKLQEVWEEFVAFLSEPTTWSGSASIPARIGEHVLVATVAVLLAALIAIPLGLWVGHNRKGASLAIAVSSLGRALPAYGLVAFAFVITAQLGFVPTLVALFVMSFVPMFVNTVTGVLDVDADVVDAAKGMGYTDAQIVTRVEAPLASPLMLTGMRLAAIDVIATATLAARFGGGGLGRFIIDGFSTRDEGEILVGALVVAAVAVLADRLFTRLEVFANRRIAGG